MALNIDRMNHLRAIMVSVRDSERAFDLGSWMNSTDKKIDIHVDTSGVVGEVHACGTSCCALGYAALDPKFQALGLQMTVYTWTYENDQSKTENLIIPDTTAFNTLVRSAKVISGATSLAFFPTFAGIHGLEAGSEFFGITYEDAESIFLPESYISPANEEEEDTSITPDMVIGRIDEVMQEHADAASLALA